MVGADRATMPKSRKFMLRDMVDNCAILCFNCAIGNRANKEGRIMPKRLREEDLASIVDVVRQSPDGARRSDIAKALKDVPQRTLQYWLKNLVGEGRLAQEGKGPAAKYRLPSPKKAEPAAVAEPWQTKVCVTT